MHRASMKLAVVLLGLEHLTLVGVAGAAFVAGPRRPPASSWFMVASVSDVDETPRRVAVLSPERDAWTRWPDRLLGHVFVRRLPDQRVQALRAEHGNLFIAVVFDETAHVFRSRCWRVTFDLDGKEIAEEGRPTIGHEIEQVEVRIVGGAVWVRYEAAGARGSP
jgi:hypothetical protein